MVGLAGSGYLQVKYQGLALALVAVIPGPVLQTLPAVVHAAVACHPEASTLASRVQSIGRLV
jgi:hypothetical protein